jgi:opacity protein-like surface antigen
MTKRFRILQCASAMALLTLASAATAQAQISRVESGRNSVNFNIGYFALRGTESRVADDVLVADLFDVEPLAFEVKDFNSATFGAEWLFGVGDYLEAGVGASFYKRTVPSVYLNVINDNGREIEQDLKLRIIPLSATVRFLPLGRGGVEPYVGAGIGVFNWKYSEVGEFVDPSDSSIFADRFVASGTSVGPVVLGGIRFPVSDVWQIGGEIRYQKAEGKNLLDEDFLGDKIDLGGWTTSFTFGLRF